MDSKTMIHPSATNKSEPDLYVITSDGLRIPAHSTILASASPVLENIIYRPRKYHTSQRTIRILGVPSHAVNAFLTFLYFPRCSEEHLDKYWMHLLALSHVYLVPKLKQRCILRLSERLTTDNVVDLLQLSRLCDAPNLYLKCLKLLTLRFKTVEKTEGWQFLQQHDPWLELDILSFMEQDESRKKRLRRLRKEQSLYMQLSEAMNCLEHIYSEGCTNVRPCDIELQPPKKKEPCSNFSTCQGLQLLIKHFAFCTKRVNGGCLRCKRMWQLLRLHSSLCDQTDSCRVPLCRQFKLRIQQVKGKDNARWKLLVRKVASAKAMNSLSMSGRMREERIMKFKN